MADALGLPFQVSGHRLVELLVEREGASAAAERIGGSCAWIVWDPVGRRLVACRDRLGLQPLFYARSGQRVAFDSQPTRIAATLNLPCEPDPPAVAAHLQGRFLSPGRSYLRGIAAVPPAHLVVVTAAGILLDRYWNLDPNRPEIPAAASATEVERMLRTVVSDTMSAESTALTLSSGLDTGALALFWRQTYPKADLDAILWATPELPVADESPTAHQVAGELGLRSHDVRADWRWPLSTGKPLGGPDSPYVPYYAEVWEETLDRTRRIGATRLATGAGGDHLVGFCGLGAYTYVDLLMTGRWVELARQIRSHNRVSPASLGRILDRDLIRPIAHLLLPAWRPRRRVALPWLGPAARQELGRLEPRRPSRSGSGLPARRHRLAVLSNPGVAMPLSDLGARARRHGVELCHPLLDHRLVELAARLPSEVCFQAGYYKVVLRDLLRDHLPAEVVDRREKVTPEAIFDRGIRERQVTQVEELITGMEAARRGWVNEEPLRHAYDRYLEDGRGGSRIWSALTLEHWLRQYF